MKMHTFFLSGKAIAIVSVAAGACGMLLFVSGMLVGVRVQFSTIAPATASRTPAVPAAPGAPAATPAGSSAQPTPLPASQASVPASTAPSNNASGGVAQAGSPADGAWPFTASSYIAPESAFSAPVTSPAAPEALQPTQPTQPMQRAPSEAPAPRRAAAGRVSTIAYVAQPMPEDAPAPAPAPARDGSYLVQVGTFRVEQHARELADRLTNAGYTATVSIRQEGDKSLHVVRVGRFTGLDVAERVAAKIGGSEQLVASVVASASR